MNEQIKVEIYDGIPRFLTEGIEEPLLSWLDNCIPEELISGTVTIDLPCEIHWSDDGPTIVVGDTDEA